MGGTIRWRSTISRGTRIAISPRVANRSSSRSTPLPTPRALAQGIAASRCLLHLGDDWVDAGDLSVRRDRFDGVPGLVLARPPRPIL
jgi:hypothetical protein